MLRHELDEYTVRNSVTRKDETIHISLLRPFLFDANFIDPTDVAMKDSKQDGSDMTNPMTCGYHGKNSVILQSCISTWLQIR